MDFVILKINGLDLSAASHDTLIRVFQSAQEPITVEVARQQLQQSTTASSMTTAMVPAPTPMTAAEFGPTTRLASSGRGNLLISSDSATSSSSMGYLAHHYNNRMTPSNGSGSSTASSSIAMATIEPKFHKLRNRQEHCSSSDNIQVTLYKSGPSDIFGLTLSYETSSTNLHDDAHSRSSRVIISAIEAGSVADRDPRLEVGQRIVRISGHRVHTKAQVVALFHRTNVEVTLQLSGAPLLQHRCDQTVEEEDHVEYSCVYDEVDDAVTRGNVDSGVGTGVSMASVAPLTRLMSQSLSLAAPIRPLPPPSLITCCQPATSQSATSQSTTSQSTTSLSATRTVPRMGTKVAPPPQPTGPPTPPHQSCCHDEQGGDEKAAEEDIHNHYYDVYESAAACHEPINVSVNLKPPPPDTPVVMEWVIKRRPDGSRYITRRPIKDSSQSPNIGPQSTNQRRRRRHDSQPRPRPVCSPIFIGSNMF